MIWNRLLHIHPTLTAGSALIEVMSRIPGVELWEESRHHSYSTLAKWCTDRDKPVPPSLVVSRNPWDWYPTMWAWVRGTGDLIEGKGGKRAGYQKFQGSFEEYVNGIRFPARPHAAWPFLPLSYHWWYSQGDRADKIAWFADFGRTVGICLSEIMPDLLDGPTTIQEMVVEIGIVKQLIDPDTGEHLEDYRHYHTARTRQWVQEMDGWLIRHHEYKY